MRVNKKARDDNVARDMAAGMRKRIEDAAAIASGKATKSEADPFIR